MIAIVSSAPRERTAFTAVCESHRWPSTACDSLRAFKKLIQHTRVSVVLTRHRLTDGYSENVIAATAEANSSSNPKFIVLLGPGTIPTIEARQVKLGADCVLRDPVRMEVLLEYLAKYRSATTQPIRPKRHRKQPSFLFADGRVHLVDRQFQRGTRKTPLTPRQIELMETLVESTGQVVSYQNLFEQILGRRFRGDTSNLRVLLGLLGVSARKVGVSLRNWVEVIPKLGYRYRPPSAASPRKSSQHRR